MLRVVSNISFQLAIHLKKDIVKTQLKNPLKSFQKTHISPSVVVRGKETLSIFEATKASFESPQHISRPVESRWKNQHPHYILKNHSEGVSNEMRKPGN